MADDVVIRAEGLGKKYVIGHQAARERYTTLRDSMMRSLRNWSRSARDMMRGHPIVAGDETEEFWALKDVNFEIKRGDVVGIIGRNGAGKSTLLKILSRITEPSEGRVTIDGRVASLLEVGTGFHPELSGRENIYLNGAILGMTRAEIKKKFEEIVDFAGVEKFLDTPVKRYSSGMYVRLAFAVAAHLEPEILVVDEVLAVGDVEFQKKCIGKMKDVATGGRTVLFVSHDLGAISSLCDRCHVLNTGTLAFDGMVGDGLKVYQDLRWQRVGASRDEGARQHLLVQVTGDLLHIHVPPRSTAVDLVVRGLEFRVILETGSGQRIAIASKGGFGSKPVEVEALVKGLQIEIEVTGLAGGVYGLILEILESGSLRPIKTFPLIAIELGPVPLPGETHALHASWGHGYIRMPARIMSLKSHDFLENV